MEGLVEEADQREDHGDWDGAIACLEKIHPKTHDVLKRLVRIYYWKRDYAMTVKYTHTHSKLFVRDCKAYLKACQYLVPALGGINKLREAQDWMNYIVKTYTTLNLRGSKAFARFCMYGSHLLSLTNRDVGNDALSVLMTAKGILEKYPLCEDHIRLAIGFGKSYYHMKSMPCAIVYYKDALVKCRKFKGMYCYDYGYICEFICNIYLQLGQYEMANMYAIETCDVFQGLVYQKHLGFALDTLKKTETLLKLKNATDICRLCSKAGGVFCYSKQCMEKVWVTRKGDSLKCQICHDYFAILNPGGVCDNEECKKGEPIKD